MSRGCYAGFVFEFLFKHPPTVFRKGEFVLASGWPVWLLVLLIAALAGGLLWHLARSQGWLDARRRRVVWALQGVSAALLLLMLWRPAVRIESLRPRQNVVAVLLDTSRSMALGEGGKSRLDQARTAMDDGVIDRLRQKFRVRLYGFSAGLSRVESFDPEKLPPPGNATRVGDAVAAVLRESAALPLGAVVVLSDGSDNAGSLGRELMAEIRRHKVPVHTIGVGREKIPGDVELSDVIIAPRALPNSRLSAQLTLRHSGAEQRKTRVTVRDGSTILASKQITLLRGESFHNDWVDFHAGDAGIHNLAFSVEPMPDEEITGNNSLTRVVDVPPDRRKILYVEGEPRWEYKFMRRAVHKDGGVQLVTLLRTSPNKFYRQGVDVPEELEDGFPVKPEELFAYDALILGSVEAGFFTAQQQEMIREFVNRRGGTLLMLAGRNGLGDGGWGTSRVAEVLPVHLPRNNGATFFRTPVSVELTPQGRGSLICRFDEDHAKNLAQWKEMPALADYQRVGKLKPAAVGLIQARADTKAVPILVQQSYGRGKSMVLATAGTWRWKMGLPQNDERHPTFWRQLFRAMVNSPGTLTISGGRTLYADDPSVSLQVEARTRAYEPAAHATVTALLTPEFGDSMTLDLHPSTGKEGIYETEFVAARPGPYRIEVTARQGDQVIGSEVLHFRREDGVAEHFHPARNREILERLAEQTGGRHYALDEVDGLPEEVRFSQSGLTARETMDLWDMPVLFLLLLGLRGGEWLLRRRWGVI